MDLIPLPLEAVAASTEKKIKKIVRSVGRCKQKTIMTILHRKDLSREEKTLKKTYLRMEKYIRTKGNMESNELEEMVNDMHRCIISIKKRKINLQRNKQK